jgi:hypothetical protein
MATLEMTEGRIGSETREGPVAHGRRRMLIVALVAACLAGTVAVAQERPAAPPDRSPVDAVSDELARLKASGQDVTALQAELAGLRKEWDRIHVRKRELEKAVEAFRPRMEGLVHKVQGKMAAAGVAPESPITGIQRGLDHLRGQGKDVAALQSELDGLKPGWDGIRKLQAEIGAITTETQKRKHGELDRLMQAFKPRVESLVHKVQTLASAAAPGR